MYSWVFATVLNRKNMFKCLFIIYAITQIIVVSSSINYSKLSDKEKKDLRHKWETCCKANTCISNSCYIVQWSASSWASVRQRCQSQYPEWPYIVDIFRIKNEADLRIFWTMLQNPSVPVREKPKTVWTSGTRCPKASSGGTKLITRWVSSEEPFQSWLEEKTSSSSHSGSIFAKRCEYLAVSPASRLPDVKYDFKDQNAHHSAICEFSIPGTDWTYETGNYPQTPEDQTTQTLTNETEKFEPKDTTPITEDTTTTKVADKKTPGIPSHKIGPIASIIPSSSTHTAVGSKTSVATTKNSRMCRAINESGIFWPETAAGEHVERDCPKGMTGTAKWQCNEKTLTFWPKKPHIEECKHEWIEHIEDSIKKRDDAVEISSRLARETKHNTMSHGDIIALINVTSKLFLLYTEQKGEEEFETTESEEIPTYYNFSKTMISSISNILREDIKDAWEGLNETRQTKEASTILKLVTTIGSRLSCIKISSEKLQFTVSEKNIDLQTFIFNNTYKKDDIVRFPQETEGVKANSFITLPANFRLKTWSSPCKNYKSAVGVMYKHVGDFLKAGQRTNNKTIIATKVLGFSLSNSTESISLSEGKAYITLKHLKTEGTQDQTFEKPRCVFWNFSKSAFGEWDASGCSLESSNETHTVCKCDHLTNFAVLMDINNHVKQNDILAWMTYVCCGFSCISLILTLVCFIAIRSLHGRRSIITGNLSFTLLISNGLIMFGLDKTKNKIVCAVIAGILHYWLLSAFCWMLVEGYHLYRMVILVFQRGSNISVKFYYLFAYGTPLIIVGISAGIRKEGYGTSKFCWLSAAKDEYGLIWSFVAPVCAIILVNLVVFILTLRSASSVKIKKEQSTVKRMKSWIRGSISVMCLLGLTWFIGLFYINENFHFISYIFTVLNGLQGVFIFLFHILLNDKVGSFFSCKENTMKGNKKFLNHTSSNQTHSKTSTRTSMNSLGCASSTRLADTRNSVSNQILSDSRGRTPSRTEIESSEASKRNFRKKKVLHTSSSNGLRSNISPCDVNVRIRSMSASNHERNHIQVSQKSRIAPF